MHNLYELASHDIRVREIFVHIGADPFLQVVHNALMHEHDTRHDRRMLLIACRRAMVCTEENVIHGLAKEVSYMLDASRTTDATTFAEAVVRCVQLDSVAHAT